MSAPESVLNVPYRAFLFDMDGTILTSIAAAERVWAAWAVRHGVDVENFLPTIHGVRAIDTINRLALPGVDAEAEAAWITEAEIEDVEGVEEVAGAARFLQSLPADQWAIVTSAPRALALRRMAAAGIPEPAVLVTAEDVAAGKPDPAGYRLAAQRLDVEISDCLVFEDATVGILAAEAAGADLLIVTATHEQPIVTAHATLAGYDEVVARVDAHGVIRLRTLHPGSEPARER
ncbi:HAD-IA family hydrolase [Pseudomonas umsongensis]|uniref:HAD-IA family hydrolase n=1 Tax=Pseudomonas umsongensis TaxID=198618 RepID=UPI00200A4343|nr:HAD-IA family hydrolase [Pseudomonas umsongensis]MCK8687089.1 HAD-IA family hydrolase [Pseudomonas umsongensis]